MNNLRQTIERMDKGNKLLNCPREDCSYTWEYSGKMPMATCPSCGYKCVVSENIVTEKE